MNQKKFLLIVILLATVAASITTYLITNKDYATYCNSNQITKMTSVIIGNSSITVEVADTPQLQECGLMFRDHLDSSTGMLFIFEKEDRWTFWMKNMHMPVDIIWINADHKIVDIRSSVPPCTSFFCETYQPSEPAKYVLEVNAGYADAHGIKINDRVIVK